MFGGFSAEFRVLFAVYIAAYGSVYCCPRICHCGYHDGAHTLECESQGLVDVVENIPEWTTLMDLDGNEITVLDLNFCAVCIYFEELSLRYNRIGDIIATSNKTRSALKRAAFCGRITEIFPRLWSVNLRGNLLRGLPKCLLYIWPSLKYLNLNENNVKSLRNLNLVGSAPHTNSLEELHLQSNRITQLLKKDLYSNAIATRKLRVLSLSSNEIHTIESGVFTFFDDLIELDISRNKIGFLPDYAFVTKGQALQTLKLDGNYIGWISMRSFAGLQKLKTLDLRNNEIKCILPKYWSTCQFSEMISTMDITFPVNPSTRHFHRRFKYDFRSLRRIYLNPNPWSCSCKLKELLSSNSTSLAASSMEAMSCDSPLQYQGELVAVALQDLACDSQN